MSALFTGSAHDAAVHSGWLWVARICAGIVVLFVVAIVGSVARRTWDRVDLARRKRAGQM